MTEREAIEQVRRAIEDEGINPGYHRAQIARLRSEWPALWKAIQDALNVLGNSDRRKPQITRLLSSPRDT